MIPKECSRCHKQTDIATYRLNQPMGQFSENNYEKISFKEVVVHLLAYGRELHILSNLGCVVYKLSWNFSRHRKEKSPH